MTENFLEKVIVETKRRLNGLQFNQLDAPHRKTLSLSQAIKKARHTPVIAELKPASPVLGKIREVRDPVYAAQQMLAGGAIAISVITEPKFFDGSEEFLTKVRRHIDAPILMKDFFIDKRQIPYGRKLGADAILLIADVCPSLPEFYDAAINLGLEPLVEIGEKNHIELIRSLSPELVGINNRDLRTLKTDLQRTKKLAPLVREACPAALIVSESGIATAEDARFVLDHGADAILVGTSLMNAAHLRAKVKELVESKR